MKSLFDEMVAEGQELVLVQFAQIHTFRWLIFATRVDGILLSLLLLRLVHEALDNGSEFRLLKNDKVRLEIVNILDEERQEHFFHDELTGVLRSLQVDVSRIFTALVDILLVVSFVVIIDRCNDVVELLHLSSETSQERNVLLVSTMDVKKLSTTSRVGDSSVGMHDE